jgi:hypothetical protein
MMFFWMVQPQPITIQAIAAPPTKRLDPAFPDDFLRTRPAGATLRLLNATLLIHPRPGRPQFFPSMPRRTKSKALHLAEGRSVIKATFR